MTVLAVVFSIVGSSLLALNVENSWVGYWIMLVGSLLWLEICIQGRQIPAVCMWVCFVVINFAGVYRWTPW